MRDAIMSLTFVLPVRIHFSFGHSGSTFPTSPEGKSFASARQSSTVPELLQVNDEEHLDVNIGEYPTCTEITYHNLSGGLQSCYGRCVAVKQIDIPHRSIGRWKR